MNAERREYIYSAHRGKVTVAGSVLRPSWKKQMDMQSVDCADCPMPEWHIDRAEADSHSIGLHAIDIITV